MLQDPFLEKIAWAILILPFASFAALALFGDWIKQDKEEDGACLVACLTPTLSFLISVFCVVRLGGLMGSHEGLRFAQPYLGKEGTFAEGLAWIQAGGFEVPFNLLLDSLSSVMILVVTGVGSLIHIYSLGYMAHDEDRVRYFSYLNLFTFFMLLLVLGGSLPLMFIGWEGVGLCSYLLIGFWFKKKSAADAGKKAFIVNRIGDAGLIIGMVLAFNAFGSLDLVTIADHSNKLVAEPLGQVGVVTAVCLLLFVGACGKSAQIPLHVWLPDAMEGPTPVSALIHAATMVTAGVYMVARLAPLYHQSQTALAVVAVIGAATAVLGATIALVQTDIKKVLAYSTVSQLGYMFLACGVGAFGVAIFHLYTHAFFKALLFLGAGSVIHAMSNEQDMRKMGGLRKKIPVTYWTFFVGTLAIAGIPPLSGFFSKDEILHSALSAGRTGLFAVGLFTALLTAHYMGRLLFMTFWGSFRGGPELEHHVHESPWTMLIALVILAIGSAVAGFVDIPRLVEPVFRLVAEHGHSILWLPYLAAATAAAGILAAYYAYVLRPEIPDRVAARFKPVVRLLEQKYGFDLAYDSFARKVVVGGGEALWRGVDTRIIDGLVNGTAGLVDAVARQTRYVQSGLVRAYVLLILGGAVAVIGYILWS